MSQSGLSTGSDGGSIDRIAPALGASELVDVARAVRECCGSTVARRYGDETAAVAALVVASRRSPRRPISCDAACKRLGIDQKGVAHATEVFEMKLTAPAPACERRRLRQSIVALDELLAVIEAGRTNPPRVDGPGFEAVEPRVRALASHPLDGVDADALRRDRRRFAADLALARLGVELFVQTRAEPER